MTIQHLLFAIIELDDISDGGRYDATRLAHLLPDCALASIRSVEAKDMLPVLSWCQADTEETLTLTLVGNGRVSTNRQDATIGLDDADASEQLRKLFSAYFE